MTTAWEKEHAAAALRRHADEISSLLDDMPALSAEAWDCPAADAFVEGLREQDARLGNAAHALRAAAADLEAAAARQRAAAVVG